MEEPAFANAIRGIRGSTKAIPTCVICFEDNDHNEGIRFNCGHFCCSDCYKSMTREYKGGDLFEPARHFCPCCPSVWIPRETDEKYFDKQFPSIYAKERKGKPKTYRFCKECKNLFGTTLRCGATEENVPLYCPEHLPFEAPRKSPCCGIMTLLGEGCNHIHCDPSKEGCGKHWCWIAPFFNGNPLVFESANECYRWMNDNMDDWWSKTLNN